MRHQNHRSKLNRTSEHRKALMRNLAIALITHERIHTTEAKAKQLRPFVEHLVTLGRDGSTHNRRLVFADLQEKEATAKVFSVLGPRFAERPGGYTRVVKADTREGDGASMSYIEFVERTAKKTEEETPKKKGFAQRMRDRVNDARRTRNKTRPKM